MNEKASEYLRRNSAAIDQSLKLFDDPAYSQMIENIRSAPDSEARARFEAIAQSYADQNVDLEALHRHVRAMNKRSVEEGLLPPEAMK